MPEMPEEFDDMTKEESTKLIEMLSLKKEETIELSELNEMLSQMKQIFETGKYEELLGHIENIIGSAETALKKFQGVGLSLAILSSQKWIDSIRDIEISVKDAEELLDQSKRNFLDDAYDDATKAIQKLRDMTSDLHKEQKERLFEMIKDVESHIGEAKSIGTNVIGAERMIKEAKVALENDLLIMGAESVRKAQVLIGEAGEERITVIKEAMAFVESITEEAKKLGADVEAPSKHMEKARAFFDNKDFQMCMHTTIQAEEMTTELIDKQVNKAIALKKSLEDRYRVVATKSPYQQVKSEEIEWEVKNSCPTCGSPLNYIEEYKRWYCYNCQKYA